MARPGPEGLVEAAPAVMPAVFFSTDIPNNLLQLDNVIVNEFHVLRRFHLISLCDEPLQITLDSNLGSQLGFQLNNENLTSADESSGDLNNFASFLADDFNELFNTVNLVHQVILQPRQVQQVIITFRPSDISKEAVRFVNLKEEADTLQQSTHQEKPDFDPLTELSKDALSDINRTFEVNGKLFLSGTGLNNDNSAARGGCRQDIVVRFLSRVCKSLLRADVADIVFNDCAPGGVFVKDFSIWNLCDIPCSYQLHVKNIKPELSNLDLTDYDTGIPVAGGEIKSCAHRRIRVTFKPRDLGDYGFTIQLDNNYDGRNSICIPVHCSVNADHRQEGLLVTGVGEDGVLDFGDCYAENGTCQMLTLRNITQEALVVSLGTDHAPGDQVAIYLQADVDISAISAKFHPEDTSYVEDALGKSLDCLLTLDKKNRVEETLLERGEEQNILVWLYPIGAMDETKAVKLHRRNFRISLKCAEKKGSSSHNKQGFAKIIQCKARVCTSIIRLSTSEMNLGDCNIGSSKGATVEIQNLSDLPALITAHVTSTILSFKSKAERISLLPCEVYRLHMEIVPLKINLKYRKQVRIDNLLNKGNQQLLEIRARIMDRHNVLLHSLYYQLQTPSMNNLLNFDSVILNNPSVKRLFIENVTGKDLVLELSSSMPAELAIFEFKDEELACEHGEEAFADQGSFSDSSEEDLNQKRRVYAASLSKEKLLESLEVSQPRLSKSVASTTSFLVQQGGQPQSSIHASSRFPQFDKKSHNRSSFDLTNNASSEYHGLKTVLSGSQLRSADLHPDSVGHSKPLPNQAELDVPAPGSIKRVHSSAMLLRGKEMVLEGVEDDVTHDSFLDVVKRYSEMSAVDCSFSEDEEARKFVDRLIKDRELLISLLDDAPPKLNSVGRLNLCSGEKKALYVVLLMRSQFHPSFQSRLQKFPSKINIQLLEYDKELQYQWEPGMGTLGSDDQIPTRELPIHIQVCRAVLSLAQKNISFGKMFTNEHRAKTLVLNNNSDVSIVYKIKKTGSIASGDLHIMDGRVGVLPPHRTKEVNFVFQPSLSGSFYETLTVSNIYDPSNDQVVKLKAVINRADTFWLSGTKIDFGTVNAGEWCTSQRLIIRNTSKQTRTYMLRDANHQVDKSDVRHNATADRQVRIRFTAEPKQALSQTILQPDQEHIEALERKFLGFQRKGKGEKAAKVWRQIEELRSKAAKRVTSDTDNGIYRSLDPALGHDGTKHGKESHHSEDQGMNGRNSNVRHLPSEMQELTLSSDEGADKAFPSPRKGWDGAINFALKGGDTQAILVSCFPYLRTPFLQIHRIQGVFLAYEGKNQDAVKHIHYEVSVLPENTSGMDFNVLSKADIENLPKLDLSLLGNSPSSVPSPNLSPESSESATPRANDTQELDSLGHSSAGLVFNSRDTPHAPGVENSLALLAGMWRSPDLLARWRMQPGADPPTSVESEFDHTGVSDDSSNGPSRLGSSGSLYPFEPLVRIEPCRPVHSQYGWNPDLSLHSGDTPSEISSAADLARSLSSTWLECDPKLLQRTNMGSALIFHDNSDHDGFETSFLLRSTSAQDIWVQLCLSWGNPAPEVDLWVEELWADSVQKGVSGLMSADSVVTGDSSHLSVWPQKESARQQLLFKKIDSGESYGTGLLASACLKGGAALRVQLTISDPAMQLWCHSVASSVDNHSQSEFDTLTGLLRINTQPSDGIQHQLSLSMGRLDRAIKVLPSAVVFPESDLSSVLAADITITNRTGKTVEFVAKVISIRPVTISTDQSMFPAEPVIQIEPAVGEIKAFGSIVVKITCQPTKPGKQTYTIHVRSLQCFQHTVVSITLSPHRCRSLRLPDISDGGTLDMGYCFLNAPGGIKGVSLRLENVLSESVALTFKSNLAKQAYISLDSSGAERTDEIDLAAHGCRTVFMCLRPGGDSAAYEIGQCREIIGGLRITVRSSLFGPNQTKDSGGSGLEIPIDEVMVKFRAMVGWSLLQLSSLVTDLGRVKEIGGSVSGTFYVSNPSSQMPLEICLSSQQAVLSLCRGILVGREVAKSLGEDAGTKADLGVEYSLLVKEHGLIEDKIMIHNLSCEGQDADLLLRLFASNGSIEATVNPPLPHLGFKRYLLLKDQRGEQMGVDGDDDVSPHTSDMWDTTHDPACRGVETSLSNATKVRLKKAMSTGSAEGNLGIKRQEDQIGSHLRTTVLEDNICLELGTVFVSEDRALLVHDPDDNVHFHVSDMRPYHSSCVIWNHTDSGYVLQPFSDLPLMVKQRSQRRDAVETDVNDLHLPSLKSDKTSPQPGKGLPLPLDKFAPCGPPFLVQPGSSTFLEVSWRWIQSPTSETLTCLLAGSLCSFDGLLVFQICSSENKLREFGQVIANTTCSGPEIVEVLAVKGSICLSKGKIVNEYINLGKVGYANGWEPVEFNVDVQNDSDAEMMYQILHAPDCFMIHVEDPQRDQVARSPLAPGSRGKFRVTLLTAKLEHTVEAGPCSWIISLLNCNNPLNVMEVVIEAEMTVRTLQLAGLWHSVLLLPPLIVPSSQNTAQSIAQFTVENLSHEPLAVALEMHQVEESESLVTFEVFHSSLTESVEEIRLGPGERIDLRVSARATSDIIPSKFSRQAAAGIKFMEGIPKDTRNNGGNSYAGVSELRQSLAGSSTPEPGPQGHNNRNDLRQLDDVGFPELATTFCLGSLLLFSSPHLPDCIPICGTLIQGPLFDVLPQSLSFQARIDPEQQPLMSEGSSSVGRWDSWKDVSIPSDTLVVRNLRVFDSFHFSVRAEMASDGQQMLNGERLKRSSDRALSYLFVQPMEATIPPQGSVEVVVKPRPWSAEYYEDFINGKPSTDPIVITIFVQEVEEDGSQGCQSVSVTISPPRDVLISPSQEGLSEKQSLASTHLQITEAASKESFGVGRAQKHKHPLLGLRGCTPVSGSPQCYDFNLGQQNVSAGGRLHWDLTLIGDQESPLHYNLSTVSESDSRWLSISNCAGVVEPCEHKIVQLSFSTKAMGVYSTYLVVENIENPADLKMVHLSLEVVSPRNARPDAQSLTFFHVLVEGDRTEGRTIHMGDVYYNFWYRNRSFVIVNEATVAMEFLLSSSMEYNKSVELNFSLDNTSLKRFSSLTIDPKSSVRVWIHFCPGVFKGSIGEDVCDDMSASIYVNCRVVKDYQRCIPFHATCRYPQIGISTTDVVFSLRRPGQQPALINIPVEEVDITHSFVATGSNSGLHGRPVAVANDSLFADHPHVGRMWNAQTVLQADESLTPQGVSPVTHITSERNEGFELLPHMQVIRLSNLYSHRQLNYVVRNDSLFFETECQQPQVISSEEMGKSTVSQDFYQVIVRPIAGNIKAHQEMILKQKYVEEHVTIYNRSHPRERYTVSVRITAGYQRNFFAALGSRDSYPFRRLELGITRFLSSFYSLTSSLLLGIQDLPQTLEIKEARNDARMDPILFNHRLVVFLEDRLKLFCLSGDRSKDYRDLLFDSQYLTDELVFYSLKERWSRGSGTLELAAVQLAKLLYCTLFRCQVVQLCVDTCQAYKGIAHASVASKGTSIERVLPEEYVTRMGTELSPMENPLLCCQHSLRFLADWIGQLGHFLSYFPDSRDDLVPLRALHQRIEGLMSWF